MVNVLRRHDALLDQPMGDHCGDIPVKGLQNAVIDSLQSDTKLVDPVPKEIGLGPAQFVPISLNRSSRDKHFACPFGGNLPIQSKNGHDPSASRNRTTRVFGIASSLFAILRKDKNQPCELRRDAPPKHLRQYDLAT